MRSPAWSLAAIGLVAAVAAPATTASATPVPRAPSLWLRTNASWERGLVTCNKRYPPGDAVALCPPDPADPRGNLAIRPHAVLQVKVHGAQQVRCTLMRPFADDPTSAHIAARLNVHTVRGSSTRYRAVLPRTIPARTSGVSCTADFRDRHFTAYALGVRLPGEPPHSPG
jgi:hypothetical protein